MLRSKTNDHLVVRTCSGGRLRKSNVGAMILSYVNPFWPRSDQLLSTPPLSRIFNLHVLLTIASGGLPMISFYSLPSPGTIACIIFVHINKNGLVV